MNERQQPVSTGGAPGLLQSDRVRLIAKVGVGVALTLFVLLKVDFPSLKAAFEKVRIGDVGLAFAMFALSRFFEGVRLHLLVFRTGYGFWQSIETVFVSTFFNNFTVTIVGDGYKATSIRSAVGAWESALLIVVLERVMGVLTVIALSIVIFVMHWDGNAIRGLVDLQIDKRSLGIVGAFAVGAIAVLALFAARRNLRRRAVAGFERFRRSTARVTLWQAMISLVLTALAQVSLAAMVYVLVVAFGGALSFAENLFVMLLVYVAAYVPVSIGSLGVREGTIVYGLGWFGVAAPTALAAALLSRALIYMLAVAAGAWWAVRR